MENLSTQQTLRLIKQKCQQRNLNFTIKRSKVLQVMLLAKKAVSAYDIVDAYHAKYQQKISAISVYRMLDFLMEAQLIHKLLSSSQFIVCSHITCNHVHKMPMLLICNQCHQVEEVEIGDGLPPVLKKSILPTGFLSQDQQLELHGTCLICQKL